MASGGPHGTGGGKCNGCHGNIVGFGGGASAGGGPPGPVGDQQWGPYGQVP
jgi:hypothetical protein